MAQYLEAVLRVGGDAHLVGDAVLAMHDLALVNPRKIQVGTRRRARPKLPPQIALVRDDTPDEELTTYEGIPATTVAAALRACATTVMSDRLLDALTNAERRGLIRRREAAELRDQLGGTGA